MEVIQPEGGWAELGHDGEVDQPTNDASYYGSLLCYASTEGDMTASYDLSPVTPVSACDEPESDSSGVGSDTELTCLMADVALNGKSQSKEPDKGKHSKFSWSLLQDGTSVVVHVQGAPKVVVIPDATN